MVLINILLLFQIAVLLFFNLPCFLFSVLVTYFAFFNVCFNLVFVCEYAIKLFKKTNLESVSEILQCNVLSEIQVSQVFCA